MNCLRNSPAVNLGTVCRRSLRELARQTNSIQMLASCNAENAATVGNRKRQAGRLADEEPAEKTQRLEAVLFLAREPLTSRKLSQYANLADGTEARTLIRRLNQKLDNLGRSFRIEEVAGGFQLVSRSKFSPWLRRLEHVPRAIRLSAPAMETLAVVSYRQPVIRADIEAVRGVSCGEILNQLLSRDLVRISGRSDELGRPYLYSTTKNFLRLFGLRSLEELPRNDYLTGSFVADSNESKSYEQVDSPKTLSEGEVEEEHGVSILVEQEAGSVEQNDEELTSNTVSDSRVLRMDDEDYDYDDADEDEELEDDEDFDDEEVEVDEEEDDEEEVDEEEDDDELEDDEEYEYEEEEDDLEEDADDEEYEYEEEDDEDLEEEDDDLEDEDEDDLEDEEELVDEDEDEWEEVDGEDDDELEDDEEEEDDWEDDDWEDDEEWDEE